ncbi:MAG: autotransporter-associated beta strand repeat-containing protein [Polaromonas sp.]|nr:autotransporter-associated beta strand repeat-containing protein [Polaromonas sp.]
MGAGGAVFVATGAAVDLNNVTIINNQAKGGHGGLGTTAANPGGGGGLFNNAPTNGDGGGPNGGIFNGNINGGDYSGGAGSSTSPAGGNGGFGGGGGGGGGSSDGGTGGFGGGGGGRESAQAGIAGIGGGGGGQYSGGGGTGMGGGIFVMNGASLTIAGGLSIDGNTVAGGAAGNVTARAGQGYGAGIYLQGTSAQLTFTPASGAQTVGDVITDQNNSGGGTNGVGIGITKTGAGTLILSGANTYSGGTNLDAGTLSVSSDNKLGDATGALTFNGGILQNTSTFTTTRDIHLTGNGTFQTDGHLTAGGMIDGTGGLTKTGAFALNLLADNTYSGGTTITSGTVQVGDGGTTGSLGTGAVTNNSSLMFRRSDSFTVGNQISGTGRIDKFGSGTLTLTGDNTYSGATVIQDGTVQVGDGTTTGSLGTGNVSIGNAALVFNRSDTHGQCHLEHFLLAAVHQCLVGCLDLNRSTPCSTAPPPSSRTSNPATRSLSPAGCVISSSTATSASPMPPTGKSSRTL